MRNKILVLLCFLSYTSFAQKCDCDIYPIKMECKPICGIKLLQNGSKETLMKHFSLSDDQAQKIINVSNRQDKRSIEGFKTDLPSEDFTNIRSQYLHWLNGIPNTSSHNSANNNSGTSVNSDKIQSSVVGNTGNANSNIGNSNSTIGNTNSNGVQVNGSNNTVYVGSSSDVKTDVGNYTVKANTSGLDFEITGCRGDFGSQSVTVFFTFSNPNKVHQWMQIGNPWYSKAFDPDGNQLIFKKAKLGNSSGDNPEVELPTGLKVRGSITFGNVLPSTTSIYLMDFVLKNHNWDGGGSNNSETVEVHNIKIEWANR